jgi:hypothetical protein
MEEGCTMSTGSPTRPVLERCVADGTDRVITAAVRAAYAWSVRQSEPRAQREVARMLGVVMEAVGPGRGPVTTAEFINALQRPLGELLLADGQSSQDTIGAAVLLDGDGRLTDDALEVAGEHVAEVLASADPASGWLPSWTWMRAEQVERRAFDRLLEAGDAGAYVASRRVLVERPAGTERQVLDDLDRLGGRPTAPYGPISPDQRLDAGSSGEGWWWPCPVCRWPMRVRETSVACTYSPHRALYLIDLRKGGAPRLVARGELAPRQGPGRGVPPPPAALALEGAVSVERAVWRYIVVPGVTEVGLYERLRAVAGTHVELWPHKDLYDLHVEAGGQQWKVDVKEYRSPTRLITALQERPPAADVVVLPDSHDWQRQTVKAALPNLRVLSAAGLLRDVRRAARKLARSQEERA